MEQNIKNNQRLDAALSGSDILNRLRPVLRFDTGSTGDTFLPSTPLKDPHFKILTASLLSAGGAVLDQWEILLLADAFMEELSGDRFQSWTNPRIEKRMELVRRTLFHASREKCREPLYVPIADFPENEQASWPPLLYRTDAQAPIRPRCPQSLGLLVTCRDDAFLTTHGLAAYSTSPHRFLVREDFKETDEPPRFYSASPFPENSNVFSPDQLLADQLTVLEKAQANGHEEILQDFGESGETLPGKEKLKILSLHGSPILVRRKLTGGLLDISEKLASAAEGEKPTGRLLASDGSGLDALEILRLKMLLVTQAIEETYRYHKRLTGPHLEICPEAFCVDAGQASGRVPSFWNLCVHLSGLPAAAKVEGSPGQGVFAPVVRPHPVYLPETLRDDRYYKTFSGKLTITEVCEENQSTNAFCELMDESVSWPKFTKGDMVQFRLTPDAGGQPLKVWATVDEKSPASPGSLPLVIHVLPEWKEALKQSVGAARSGVPYAIYPCLHAPVDLHSLGMTMFAVLLTHAQQPIQSIEQALTEAASHLQSLGQPDESDSVRILASKAGQWISTSRHAGVFERNNIFSGTHDRLEGRPNAIPKELWLDTLLVAMRMTIGLPRFGFCSHRSDFDPNYPAGIFEPVLAEMDTLIQRMDAVLLGRQAGNLEVRYAIRSVIRGLEEKTDDR